MCRILGVKKSKDFLDFLFFPLSDLLVLCLLFFYVMTSFVWPQEETEERLRKQLIIPRGPRETKSLHTDGRHLGRGPREPA